MLTREMMEQFAAEHGITVEKAVKLMDNLFYRAEYAAKYNKRPEVKAKRAQRNRVEYNLRKALKEFAKSENAE